MNDAPKTNAEIRQSYLKQVAQIPARNEQWLAQGLAAKVRMMPTKTVNYLVKNISWKRTTDAHYPFAAEVEGESCMIRLNDFPAEHLYTLMVNGKEIVSFDDWSAQWSRPAKAKIAGQAAKSLAARRKPRLSSKVVR